MEIFYSNDIEGQICRLDREESVHCVKVLRHKEGDEIFVMDGRGSLFTCTLTDASPSGASALVRDEQKGWGSHPYHLTMAVCPTKNSDRYEWFAEKATEMGLDCIVPVIGEHSERKVFKTDRLKRILLSASKQSLKGTIPEVEDPVDLKRFIKSLDDGCLKLIACCFDGRTPRESVSDVLRDFKGDRIVVLIGPEGDFSEDEVSTAVECGFKPIHLGPSRLRTETAALTAVAAVYLDKGLCI